MLPLDFLASNERVRRAITVTGIVQGVGFRPFLYGLAERLGLAGFAQNLRGGVLIELEGAPRAIDAFVEHLAHDTPPLATIATFTCADRSVRGDSRFEILPSSGEPGGRPRISSDIATCDDCLRELFDPTDRRYLYPFINCTHCGPRLTIVCGHPYDRARTTMARFTLCADCQREYDDPRDRRFHAQTNACAMCGPVLRVVARDGERTGAAALAWVVAALRAGQIGAIKGLGGYHLACDATSAQAVRALRQRKRRFDKPFAVMVADLAAVERIAFASPEERRELASPERPIVLVDKRDGAVVAPEVAPASATFGVMLPYTPLHHLLLREMSPLVMTSGNVSDEPIAFEDGDAFERLADVADFVVCHDRPIERRCDDSVVRVVDGAPLPLRRSRGFAPRPLDIGDTLARATLALGAHSDVTVALGDGAEAVVSHHLGDLDHFPAYRAYTDAVAHYEQLFSIEPVRLVHDLHPDYASTRYAHERASAESLERIAVQHHHAHVASCMAEHALAGPVIGVAFDGTGYGTDGALWGGEFFVGTRAELRRAAHFRYLPLPGGEHAIREPWRMALAALLDAGEPDTLLRERVSSASVELVSRQIAGAPRTSSAGRLFDAVAALASVRDRVTYEGQAAIELEARASACPPDRGYRFELERGADDILLVDARPMIRDIAREIVDGVATERIARRFHSTIANVVVRVCGALRDATGLATVVLSGGVFGNALVTRDVMRELAACGFAAYRHRVVPPGDGGLSLGQLAVVASRDQQRTH